MNVLIADSDVATRIALCVAVEKAGHSVTSFNGGLEILRILGNTPTPAPHLVMLGCAGAGNEDGLEACRRIPRHPQMKSPYVITLAPRDDRNALANCLDAGADDCLAVPFAPEELQAKLRAVENIVALQNSLTGQIAQLTETLEKLQRLEMAMVERALQEWCDTVDAVSDMIILTDGAMNIARSNRATATFFRQEYKELNGQNLAHLLGFSAPRPEADEENGTPLNPLTAKMWEGQIACRPGEWFEVANHRVWLRKSKQNGAHWVHVIKNITERKRAEASLNLLNTVVEQAADSIIVTGADGVIQYVNPAFVSCTGWGRDEATGRKFVELHAAKLAATLMNGGEQFALLDKAWQGIYQAKRKTGENYDEEISISPVRRSETGDVLNYVAVCRDVTEKRRLESIAEAVNMTQNVGYIFSGIRHELGNPINSVKTALTVLKKNLPKWGTEQVSTYIERCLTETERVEYLLKALKTFSMYENPKMEAISLKAFMANFIMLVEGDFHKQGVEIKWRAQEDIGAAWCDPRALHQVMLNLLTNAADAVAGRTAPLITISLTRDKQRNYVCLADNGCGMSKQQVENLFKPFYTSKESGTGLGLVIVKKMIARMNGTIQIESAPDEGTKAQFTLEVADLSI